jgi:hypothetical protein
LLPDFEDIMQRRQFFHLACVGGLLSSMATVRTDSGQETLVLVLDSVSESEAALIVEELRASGISAVVVNGSGLALAVGRNQSFRIACENFRCQVIADGESIEFVEWADSDSGLLCRFKRGSRDGWLNITRVVEKYDRIEFRDL